MALAFLPYRADIELRRHPVVTVLVVLASVAVFMAQLDSVDRVEGAARRFCQQRHPVLTRLALDELGGEGVVGNCTALLLAAHADPDPEGVVRQQVARARRTGTAGAAPLDTAVARQRLTALYQRFAAQAPTPLTQRLWYVPASWDPLAMLTAALAHASWLHLAGNLFFFYAFAATIERVIPVLAFVAIFVLLAFTTHIAYSLAMVGVTDPLPTVGLSGVVMGMMGLFAFLLPGARIRCLMWIGFVFKRVGIPAWWLAAWYVGVDAYTLRGDGQGAGVNLVAHVAGALTGFAIGALMLRRRRAALHRELDAMHHNA